MQKKNTFYVNVAYQYNLTWKCPSNIKMLFSVLVQKEKFAENTCKTPSSGIVILLHH